MEAFYFANDKRLFGAFSPAEGASRRHAVLICNPLAHEAYKAHFVLRRLVDELVDNGFDVLRFDYTGTGDSWGGLRDIAQFETDIADAVTELGELASVDSLSIVATRFAAALLGKLEQPIHQLVLWDPLLDGEAYADALNSAHADLVAKHLAASPADRAAALHDELLGSAGTDRFVESLRAHRVTLPDATSVDCVLSGNHVVPDGLQPRDTVTVESECPWIDPDLRLMYNADVVRALGEVLCR